VCVCVCETCERVGEHACMSERLRERVCERLVCVLSEYLVCV
jgi:hypothetical protein